MNKKKIVYALLIALNCSLPVLLHAQDRDPIPHATVESGSESLDDVLDSYFDDVMSGDIEMEQPKIEPISHSERILRVVGGFLVMRYLTVYNFVTSCKEWLKTKWIGLKHKLKMNSSKN